MYGTQYVGGTYSFGQAFKVAPATGGGFTGTVLYNFGVTGTDSKEPYSPLTLDTNGNLYGVSNIGGTNDLGTVFRLTPPAGGVGNWTNTVLYSFTGAGAGCNPEGNIILDQAGRLYGQTTSLRRECQQRRHLPAFTADRIRAVDGIGSAYVQ
jgi:uncharacterized repeat protein (TIGR03803 family)